MMEKVSKHDGSEEWISSNRKLHSLLPASLTGDLSSNDQSYPIKKSYQLQAVISFVRGKTLNHDDYHVVHVRAPQDIAKETLSKQIAKIDECISEKENDLNEQHVTLVTDITIATLKSRQEEVQKKLKRLEERKKAPTPDVDEWLLINGLKVTKTTSDDARSFSGRLKEPSVIIFREVIEQTQVDEIKEVEVPTEVMDTISLSNGRGPLCGSSGGKLSQEENTVRISCFSPHSHIFLPPGFSYTLF